MPFSKILLVLLVVSFTLLWRHDGQRHPTNRLTSLSFPPGFQAPILAGKCDIYWFPSGADARGLVHGHFITKSSRMDR